MRSSGLDQSTLTPVWVNIAQKVICFFVCMHAQSCVLLTLCNPMECSPPDSSAHEVLQARILEWVAMSSSQGIFLTQGSNLHLLRLLHCRQILHHCASGKPFGYSLANNIV